jgi:hypothetical protein
MATIEEQLVDSSKMLIDIVASKIGDNEELFDEAMELMLKDKHPMSMRAGRVAYFVCKKHPNLAKPYFRKMANILPVAKVDGAKRCIQKILIETPYELPEDIVGELTDVSFSFIEDPKQSIAVRAFAIDIILKILKIYPEMKPELIAVLETIKDDSSVGIKNKCRRLIKKLA